MALAIFHSSGNRPERNERLTTYAMGLARIFAESFIRFANGRYQML